MLSWREGRWWHGCAAGLGFLLAPRLSCWGLLTVWVKHLQEICWPNKRRKDHCCIGGPSCSALLNVHLTPVLCAKGWTLPAGSTSVLPPQQPLALSVGPVCALRCVVRTCSPGHLSAGYSMVLTAATAAEWKPTTRLTCGRRQPQWERSKLCLGRERGGGRQCKCSGSTEGAPLHVFWCNGDPRISLVVRPMPRLDLSPNKPQK